MQENIWEDENLIQILASGGVVVMPTDTIYGIVCKAQNKEAVERVYSIRKRSPEKPCIILIGDISELEKFSVFLQEDQKNKFIELSLGSPTSIILDCGDDAFEYLHRGTKTLAFRIPVSQELKNLLLKVGPLIAPSANTEGLTPAKNIDEAQIYFSNSVDMYIDGGELKNKASKLIRLNKDGSVSVLRE